MIRWREGTVVSHRIGEGCGLGGKGTWKEYTGFEGGRLEYICMDLCVRACMGMYQSRFTLGLYG